MTALINPAWCCDGAPRQGPRQGAPVRFLGREDERGRESDVPHGGSKNSMPRLNIPSSTASSVRSLRRGRYAPVFLSPPFVRAKRESERGEREEKQVPKILRGAIVDGLDAFSTTYLPTVEPARPVSRPPRYTKEFPAALPLLKRPPANRRGDPQHVPRRISRPPSDCHVRQWRSSDSKNLAFRTNRHRVARSRSSSCLFVRWKIFLMALKNHRRVRPPSRLFQILLLVLCTRTRSIGTSSCLLATFRAFFARLLFPFFSFFRFSFLAALTSLPHGFSYDARLSVWPCARAMTTIQGRETLRVRAF